MSEFIGEVPGFVPISAGQARKIARDELQKLIRDSDFAAARAAEEEVFVPSPIFKRVMVDLARRDMLGHERYGGPLVANNGRDALLEAYEEALDLVVYLRQALDERELEEGS